MKKIFLTTLFFAVVLGVSAQRYISRNAETKEQRLNKEYCSPLFQSADGTIIDLTEDNTSASGYLNILDWLQGRVAGLQVYTLRNGSRIPVIRGRRAGVFIDEMPVDASFLNALAVSDIAMIKVIKDPFVGSIGMNSAIAIYTLRYEEEEEEK